MPELYHVDRRRTCRQSWREVDTDFTIAAATAPLDPISRRHGHDAEGRLRIARARTIQAAAEKFPKVLILNVMPPSKSEHEACHAFRDAGTKGRFYELFFNRIFRMRA